MSDPVYIVEYDPRWPEMYEQERGPLLEALYPFAVDIQHVGSTSVLGVAAKPIVDIGVGIKEYPLPESSIEAVVALGYEYFGEWGIPAGITSTRAGPAPTTSTSSKSRAKSGKGT